MEVAPILEPTQWPMSLKEDKMAVVKIHEIVLYTSDVYNAGN